MLDLAFYIIMQSVVTLSVNIKSVTMPNVSFLFDMQSVVKLNVILESVDMTSTV